MSDDNNTSTIRTDASLPEAEQGAVQPPVTEVATKPAPASKRTSSKARTADEEPKLKCAFCDKVAVFEQTTTVGTHAPISYHGCDASTTAIFEWMQATHADASAPAPATSKK